MRNRKLPLRSPPRAFPTGSSQGNVQIYVFLLKNGVSTAPEISKSTGIDKATVYRSLNNLNTIGCVSEIVIKNIKRFSAAQPNKLIDKADEFREELKAVVPELIKLTTMQRTTAQVELYQGIEGVKTVMQNILNERKPYCILGHAQTFFEEIPVYCGIWMSRI